MKHHAARIAMLKRRVPELFNGTLEQQYILYIGARPDRVQGVPELHAVGHVITAVELVPEFIEELKQMEYFNAVINQDVRDYLQELPPEHTFDVSIWWHGPEHVPASDFASIVALIEAHTQRLVILASPYGRTRIYKHKQPGQVHVSAFNVKDYTSLGYDADTIGRRNAGMRGQWSHIMAWKWLERP